MVLNTYFIRSPTKDDIQYVQNTIVDQILGWKGSAYKDFAMLLNFLNLSVLVATPLQLFHPFPIFLTHSLSCGGTCFDFRQCILS